MPFVRPSRSDQRLWFEAGEAMRLHKAANMFAQRPGAYPLGTPLEGGDSDTAKAEGVVRLETASGLLRRHTCFSEPPPECLRAFVLTRRV